MSCSKRLRTDFRPDLESGGTWEYIGYHPTNYNVVSTAIVPASSITQVNMSSDDPTIVTLNATPGFYGFRYTLTDDCTGTKSVKVYLQVEESNSTYITCDYWSDLNPHAYSNQTLLDTLSISSFKVNGVEQLTDNVLLGTFVKYDLGGSTTDCVTDHNYIKAIPDTLNSINIKGFTFEYTDREETGSSVYSCGYKYVTVNYPSSVQSFEIIIQERPYDIFTMTYGNFSNHTKWTKDSSFKWNSGSSTWIDQGTCTGGCVGEFYADNNVRICS